MKFVLVNDRAPRLASVCAHCGKAIETGYVRDLSSRRAYCDEVCHRGQKTGNAREPRIGAGIDGLTIRGLIGNGQTAALGIL